LKRRATMKEVAQVAGVSTATVARVLHNNGYVSEEAVQRVRDAIGKTEYNLNVVARSLRQQRTYTLGHILQSMAPNPFFVEVALGAEEYARQKGYSVLSYNVQGSKDTERAAVETFINRRVDAILFTTPVDAANVEFALNSRIPVIQVERPLVPRAHQILVDNYTGATEAVEHLIGLGHRRIAFIGQGAQTLPSTARYVEVERLSAYKDALTRHELPIDPGLIAYTQHYYKLEDRSSLGESYRFTCQLLQSANPPTAIFVTNDIMAAGVLQSIYEANLRVPDDISIVGFDDTYAQFLAPLLTTVRLPMHEIGASAARLAIELIEGQQEEAAEPQKIMTHAELIVRKSTGPVRTDVGLGS
jgi:DNA-binding LacI/PurR family transcriptional regulator